MSVCVGRRGRRRASYSAGILECAIPPPSYANNDGSQVFLSPRLLRPPCQRARQHPTVRRLIPRYPPPPPWRLASLDLLHRIDRASDSPIKLPPSRADIKQRTFFFRDLSALGAFAAHPRGPSGGERGREIPANWTTRWPIKEEK